jgi:hypothetical protein
MVLEVVLCSVPHRCDARSRRRMQHVLLPASANQTTSNKNNNNGKTTTNTNKQTTRKHRTQFIIVKHDLSIGLPNPYRRQIARRRRFVSAATCVRVCAPRRRTSQKINSKVNRVIGSVLLFDTAFITRQSRWPR